MSNTSLRERFNLADEDYQLASAVIADARKAGRIIPADPSQGKKNARYVPYWESSWGLLALSFFALNPISKVWALPKITVTL